jgi:iron complex transport system ATP-binding protein
MFAAANIDVVLSGRPVLHDISFAPRRGELTVILGPNGAGKSTLLRVLTGDLKPSRGQVTCEGRPLAQFSAADLARRRAVLSQSSHLAFPFTVLEVVRLGLYAMEGRLAPRDVEVIPEQALAAADLEGFGGRFYQELSGGEQQRVQLARVLCQAYAAGRAAPAFLFLDEPVSNLDIRHQLLTLETVREFAGESAGALMILHDLNLASLFADRIVVMAQGRIAADGSPREVLQRDLIARVYGVDLDISPAERPVATPRRQALSGETSLRA